jgi:hypothetical protein
VHRRRRNDHWRAWGRHRKIDQMCSQFGAPELEMFHAVKAAFDPAGLLNPGKRSPPAPVRRHGAMRASRRKNFRNSNGFSALNLRLRTTLSRYPRFRLASGSARYDQQFADAIRAAESRCTPSTFARRHEGFYGNSIAMPSETVP